MRKQRPTQHNHALHALAVRTDTIYVTKRPELPECQPLVYVDGEGVPSQEFYYLIGVHVVTGGQQQSFSLWSDTVNDERKMWESFLRIIQRQRKFAVLHYGAYDVRAIEVLAERHGGDHVLIQNLLGSCTNVLSLIYGNVYFPTYSNGLKSIASCLGFQWSEEDASGIQSLVWRHHWESSREKLLSARFKSDAATYYEPTYRGLLDRIKTGSLVHADETKVSIEGVTRYVWVFTNLDEVAYVYSDTRERATLDTILDGFAGVLVSDFYPAYDSVDCAQQKCLIHLIRDINDDLFKNPFDEGLKELAAAFTALLVRIVETVDRYGLMIFTATLRRTGCSCSAM